MKSAQVHRAARRSFLGERAAATYEALQPGCADHLTIKAWNKWGIWRSKTMKKRGDFAMGQNPDT